MSAPNGGRYAGRRADDVFGFIDGSAHEVGVFDPVHPDGDVGSPFYELLRLVRERDGRPYIGMPVGELDHRGAQQAVTDGERRLDPQRARDVAGIGLDVGFGLGDRSEDFPAFGRERTAFIGQVEMARIALDQRDSQVLFKIAQARRDGGVRQVERFGCSGKAAAFDHPDEDLHPPKSIHRCPFAFF